MKYLSTATARNDTVCYHHDSRISFGFFFQRGHALYSDSPARRSLLEPWKVERRDWNLWPPCWAPFSRKEYIGPIMATPTAGVTIRASLLFSALEPPCVTWTGHFDRLDRSWSGRKERTTFWEGTVGYSTYSRWPINRWSPIVLLALVVSQTSSEGDRFRSVTSLSRQSSTRFGRSRTCSVVRRMVRMFTNQMNISIKGSEKRSMLGRRSMEALDVNKTLGTGKLKSKEVRVSKYRTNSYGVQLLNWHGRKIEQELTVHPLVGLSQILQCLFQ